MTGSGRPVTYRHTSRGFGSTVRLTVTAPDRRLAGDATTATLARIHELEARWSRFRATSDVSRLVARAGGGPVTVHPDTVALLLAVARLGRLTDGLVDPTMGAELAALGYDRSFELVPARVGGAAAPTRPAEAPSGGGRSGRRPGVVVVDPVAGTVALGPGTTLDLGGVGKGRIADEAIDVALASGATGACVDLGGDVAVAGGAGDGGAWVVAIEDPRHPGAEDLAAVALENGAVATSGINRRRWWHDGRLVHHILDPRTGRPADSDVLTATVIAASALDAEALAKAVVVAGADAGAAMLTDRGVAGVIVTIDGRVREVGPTGAFLVNRRFVAAGVPA